jgi:hypothetical protein
MTPYARAFLLPTLLLAAGLAQASDAELQRCRQIADASQRLRCYDALPLAATPSAPAVMRAAPAAPPAATAPAAGTPSAAADNFGLEDRSGGTRVDVIESSIVGNFEDWGPNYRFNLANGQVWQVMDGSIGFRSSSDSRVKIRRGMLGAFYLELVGTNRSPRVQRVQ